MKNFCDVVWWIGNLFFDDFFELVIFDSRDCVDISVVELVKKFYKFGKE